LSEAIYREIQTNTTDLEREVIKEVPNSDIEAQRTWLLENAKLEMRALGLSVMR